MKEQEEQSLRGRVLQQIRDGILSGKYETGDELREVTVGKELGASRTPVREALRQLELEGLVEIIPNKGARVNGITSKDVRDIYEIRSYLEGLAARWATENVTEEQLNELEEIVLLSEFHLRKEQQEQMVSMDGRFHAFIYKASNSRMLDHVLEDFHRYVKHARALSVATRERAQKSVREHKAILEAMKNRDPDLAEQLANEHIMRAMENMRRQGLEENNEKKDI